MRCEITLLSGVSTSNAPDSSLCEKMVYSRLLHWLCSTAILYCLGSISIELIVSGVCRNCANTDPVVVPKFSPMTSAGMVIVCPGYR